MEAIISTAVGFFLAVVIQAWLYKLYDIKVTHSQNFQIVGVLTVVSVIRGYVLRRIFNKHTVKANAEPHFSGQKEIDLWAPLPWRLIDSGIGYRIVAKNGLTVMASHDSTRDPVSLNGSTMGIPLTTRRAVVRLFVEVMNRLK